MSSTLPSLVNNKQFKHMLTPGINELSHKIQLQQQQTSSTLNTKRYLSIENEALEHISSLVLNVFNSILLANYDMPTPESTCSFAMSTRSISESEQPQMTKSNVLPERSNSSDNNNNSVCLPVNSVKVDPILDLNEAEMRVRRAIPLAYTGKIF